MADPYEAARARKRELEIEMQKLDTFLEVYETLTGERLDGVQNAPAQAKPSAGSRLIGAAVDAIVEAGRPLNRVELVGAIEAKGLTIGGNNKGNNLGSLLWRSKSFDSDSEGYWPKGHARPQSGLGWTTPSKDAVSSDEL